jgi:hypothetical protein
MTMSQPDILWWQKYGTLAQMAACEEAIVAAFASRPEWQASCNYDLKPHLPFLCEKNGVEPAYLATYSNNTQQWVKASMKTASVTPPDCKLGKT